MPERRTHLGFPILGAAGVLRYSGTQGRSPDGVPRGHEVPAVGRLTVGQGLS